MATTTLIRLFGGPFRRTDVNRYIARYIMPCLPRQCRHTMSHLCCQGLDRDRARSATVVMDGCIRRGERDSPDTYPPRRDRHR